MRSRLLIFLIFAAQLARADDLNIRLMDTNGIDGKPGYRFAVPKARLDALPDWKPDSPTIPLQPQQAIKLATARYKALYPTATSAYVQEISLRPNASMSTTRWMYWVSFAIPDGERTTSPGTAVVYLIVLLDGTVVDPEVISYPQVHHAP